MQPARWYRGGADYAVADLSVWPMTWGGEKKRAHHFLPVSAAHGFLLAGAIQSLRAGRGTSRRENAAGGVPAARQVSPGKAQTGQCFPVLQDPARRSYPRLEKFCPDR